MIIQAANNYLDLGFSVIPLSPGTKIPPKGFEVIPYRHKLTTKDEINAWWGKNPDYNIGIVTGKISDLLVIDLNRYKEEFNIETVSIFFPISLVTPTVTTPHGGEHRYFRFSEKLTIASGIASGLVFRGEEDYVVAPPSMNENGKKYIWQIPLCAAPIATLPLSFISSLTQAANFSTRKLMNNTSKENVSSYFAEGQRDESMFHIALLLKKGGASIEEMQIILSKLAEGCNPPFPPQEVEAKITSVIKRLDRKTRNVTQEVRDYCLQTEDVFSIQDCFQTLKLISPEDQSIARVTISGLTKEGNLAKFGQKRGIYRVVSNNAPIIDLQSADLEEYDIKFPFTLHELVKIYKSNIIIVAGESNAGKTAFCLNVAKMNTHKKINYLSSEMQDGTELRLRLDRFNTPLNDWDHVTFRFCSDNFPDVIVPDDLNVIDYLDEGADGEAYKMTRRIKSISEKLKKGIAMICLQKSSQKRFGLGGEGTKNMARLYLTITEQNRLTIEKSKIWRSDTKNPNGLFCHFKLVGGCKFLQQEAWRNR